MRRRGDGEALARPRAGHDLPLRLAHRREPGDPADGPEQGDDRGQVVRAHVQERAGAVREELLGVRVPGVRAADEHRRADGERLADRTLVDQGAARLEGAAQEDVRRAADPQPELVGQSEELEALRHVDRERLLGVDVLAGLERRAGHGAVRSGRRQVEHDVDRGIGQQLLDRGHGQAVRLAELDGLLAHEVGARDELERVERGRMLGVVPADHAAADDADVHAVSIRIARTASRDRRTAASASPSVWSCSTISHSTPARTAAGRTRS